MAKQKPLETGKERLDRMKSKCESPPNRYHCAREGMCKGDCDKHFNCPFV